MFKSKNISKRKCYIGKTYLYFIIILTIVSFVYIFFFVINIENFSHSCYHYILKKEDKFTSEIELIGRNDENKDIIDIYFVFYWPYFLDSKNIPRTRKLLYDIYKNSEHKEVINLCKKYYLSKSNIYDKGISHEVINELERVILGYTTYYERNKEKLKKHWDKEYPPAVYWASKRLCLLRSKSINEYIQNITWIHTMPGFGRNEDGTPYILSEPNLNSFPYFSEYRGCDDEELRREQLTTHGIEFSKSFHEIEEELKTNNLPFLFRIKFHFGLISKKDVIDLKRYVKKHQNNLSAKYTLAYFLWFDYVMGGGLVNQSYTEWLHSLYMMLELSINGYERASCFLQEKLGCSRYRILLFLYLLNRENITYGTLMANGFTLSQTDNAGVTTTTKRSYTANGMIQPEQMAATTQLPRRQTKPGTLSR